MPSLVHSPQSSAAARPAYSGGEIGVISLWRGLRDVLDC